MANLINNNYAYTVKKQPEWFYKVLQKAHTIDNGYVRVLPNVTKDTYIRKLVMANNTISQVDKGFEISGQEIPKFGSCRGQVPSAQQAADFSLFVTK